MLRSVFERFETKFPVICQAVKKWQSGPANKVREVKVVSQEEYNKIVEQNFQRRLREILDKSLPRKK